MYGALMLDIGATTLTDEDIWLIKQPQVGGLILFARNIVNPTQVRALCDDIRSHNTNIIIGIDQEGGRVARLRQGFTPLPAMGKLGQYFEHSPTKALSLAYDCGYLMATEVMAVGIDISFAPVLDINGMSQVIGDRSFHTHPRAVTALATEFMSGMQDAGMATTGKHFPGHGSLAPDTHVADAIDNRSYKDIFDQDLQPFIRTLPWLNALMPAHVIYPKVDDMPAGFSKVWLQDILREQLGFNGVIFSDDLSMQAAKIVGGVGDRVKFALDAGCDMALVCNDRVAALKAIEVAQQLPLPSQDRLGAMRTELPKWQGNLNDTCQNFEHWQLAKNRIENAFFSKNMTLTNPKDPTEYK